jgi:hypothetical protein
MHFLLLGLCQEKAIWGAASYMNFGGEFGATVNHVWSVQVYIADIRLESDYQAAINLYNRKREEARLEYETEVDPESRLRILKLISEFDQKISNILSQRERSRMAIAVPAELQFKVL